MIDSEYKIEGLDGFEARGLTCVRMYIYVCAWVHASVCVCVCGRFQSSEYFVNMNPSALHEIQSLMMSPTEMSVFTLTFGVICNYVRLSLKYQRKRNGSCLEKTFQEITSRITLLQRCYLGTALSWQRYAL